MDTSFIHMPRPRGLRFLVLAGLAEEVVDLVLERDLTPSQSCRVKADYTVWPAYEEATDQNLVLTRPLAVDHHLNGETCDFWDGYVGL